MQYHWLHICAKRRCVVSEEQVATDDISQENTRMYRETHTEKPPRTETVHPFLNTLFSK